MSSNSNEDMLPLVVNSIRAASALAAQDVDFFRSLDKDISASLTKTSEQITDMMNSVLLSVDEHSEPLESGKQSLEESWKDFSNMMDNLFEKSDRSLDILSKGKTPNQVGSGLQYLDDLARLDNDPAKRISKPQLNFSNPIDNSELHPFKPLLKEKPHAIKPLADALILVPDEEDVPSHYPHPYEVEIDQQEYNPSILQILEPISSQSWDDQQAIWVDSLESLNNMLEELKGATEIAVDLEHHDYRTYYGIVCLMQISTRKTDYLVDTIALRDELHILNEVFTNPSIVKVLHGAFMDIIWLQRDLGLYIVSLFDTFHASRALGFPRHSLAYLLERFAHFKTSKKYQLADWRIRPLSKPMNAYARADTHFLLNIYDQMKNSLIKENKLAGVLYESRNVAKRRFEYSKFRPRVASSKVFSPIEKDDPWMSIIYQYNIPLQKSELLKKLWEWRDMVARRDDESPRYVMPNQLIVSLVAYTPVDPAGVISVSNIMTDHVRSNSKVIANLLKRTLDEINEKGNIDSALSLSNNGINNTQPSETLTISQIKNMVSKYSSILSKINDSKQVSISQTNPSLLFSEIFLSDDAVVVYDKGQKHHVTQDQLRDRKEEVSSTIQEAMNTTFSMEVELTPKNIVTSKPVNSQSNVEAAVELIQTHIEQPEDMDEIIILKNVRNRNSNSQKSQKRDKKEQMETLDYGKVDKVLSEERRQRDSRKRKFDPFSADNGEHAPQAAKRSKQRTRNKNVSFKK